MKRIGLLFALFTAVASVGATAFMQQAQPKPPALEPEIVYLVTGVRATGLFHRKDCLWLKDAPQHPMVQSEAVKRYFQAHCLCITGKEGVPPCASIRSSAASSPTVPDTAIATTAPGTKVVRAQCLGTTASGARCGRIAEAAGVFCTEHKVLTTALPIPAAPARPVADPKNVPTAPAATRQQCAATTQKGARCLRMAAAGSAYCWQHP
jgi:hypothetical protein